MTGGKFLYNFHSLSQEMYTAVFVHCLSQEMLNILNMCRMSALWSSVPMKYHTFWVQIQEVKARQLLHSNCKFANTLPLAMDENMHTARHCMVLKSDQRVILTLSHQLCVFNLGICNSIYFSMHTKLSCKLSLTIAVTRFSN